jgi:hypothetical protein
VNHLLPEQLANVVSGIPEAALGADVLGVIEEQLVPWTSGSHCWHSGEFGSDNSPIRVERYATSQDQMAERI